MAEKRVKKEAGQNEVESKKAKWSKKTTVKKEFKKDDSKGKKDFKKGRRVDEDSSFTHL